MEGPFFRNQSLCFLQGLRSKNIIDVFVAQFWKKIIFLKYYDTDIPIFNAELKFLVETFYSWFLSHSIFEKTEDYVNDFEKKQGPSINIHEILK